MISNAVKIFDVNKNLLGTGLLLSKHIATVDHILNNETSYFIAFNNDTYFAQVVYRGKEMFLDIAILSVDIQEDYKPNITKASINDDIEAKGFPQGFEYTIYPDGRNISGKVISTNNMDASNDYYYRGDYVTVASDEKITKGFSGSPVFIRDELIGFIARKHIDGNKNIFNVIPASYFLTANNGNFRNLFGEYNVLENQNIIDRSKKALMNPFHFRSETIDFYGREEQKDKLFQFCSSESHIQWWAITGVGGIGKSRLAYEFANSLNENIWDSLMLKNYNYELLENLTAKIRKNIFIVLDYVQQNIRDIGRWLYLLSSVNFNYKVRILLLERHGRSYKTSKWIEQINERNCDYDALLNICYNPTLQLDPPFLVLSSLSENDLISIAKNYYFYKKNNSLDSLTAQNIIEKLSVLDPGFNRPLYLIFLLDAWIDSGDLSKWNKKFILENILERECHRIKLILRNVVNDDLLISAYFNVLIYSTIMDGLEYPNEFNSICYNELNVFKSSIEYHRKDVFEIFRQVGFLTKDHEGNQYFEGLKPDLLGEYYIFNNYQDNETTRNIVMQSITFPKRAFSFYNRLLDDYPIETDYSLKSLLLSININILSDEQIFCYAEFLCERITRDNLRYSEQCLNRLRLLYEKNRNEKIAIVYASGLSNMLVELNLKKSKKILVELEDLYHEYNDSLDIAIEYAYALVNIIKRKSIHSSKNDFRNLNKLKSKELFSNNLEMNLCYAKALEQLCFKEVSNHILLKYCKEIKSIFHKFHENDEFACIYAKCLCNLNTDLYSINSVLSQLLSICSCELVQPIYAMYIVNKFKSGILAKEESLYWLNKNYDFCYYINIIEELSCEDTNAISKQNEEKNVSPPKIQSNEELDKANAKKLAWLSNNLNYSQCKGVVDELNELYIKHRDIFEFSEYYLIGLVTLAKHPIENFEEPSRIIENILILSNQFFENFNEDLRISIYESVSKFAKYDLISDKLIMLLTSFISIVVKNIRSEEETSKIITMLITTEHIDYYINKDEYFENILINYYRNDSIQRQYTKYLNVSGKCNFEYIFEKIPIFCSLNCSIIIDFFSYKILNYSSNKVKKEAVNYISEFLSKNKSSVLANLYSELILILFLESPQQKYYIILRDLETEYRPNDKVALNYAKILFQYSKQETVNYSELFEQLKKLDNYYSNVDIALLFQKTLSNIIGNLNSSDNFLKYIDEQKIKFDTYGTLDSALEYCNSLSIVSKFISLKENQENFAIVKNMERRFHNNEDFKPFLKIIINQIKKSKEVLKTEDNIKKNVKYNDLKKQIEDLYINKNLIDIPKINLVVNETRKAYEKFLNADFAILLCKGLSVLSRFSTNEMWYDIVEEVDTIYNLYPYELLILKYYIEILEFAMTDNLILVSKKIDSIEKTLVSKIKVDCNCRRELYNLLLSILHIKNKKVNNNKLVELDLKNIVIPAVFTHTTPSKKKVDDIMYHLNIWGTVDKPIEIIIINNQNLLVDGYARWFVANNRNLHSITARILAEY